jgi:hypothetical protein
VLAFRVLRVFSSVLLSVSCGAYSTCAIGRHPDFFSLKNGLVSLVEMGLTQFGTLCMSVLFVFGMQSLTDFARQEAERRRLLEEQGIQGKVIVNNAASPASNEDLSGAGVSPSKQEKRAERSESPKGRNSANSYRTTLQKLDRQIQQSEDRLASLQARLQAEKWSRPKTRHASSRSQKKNSTGQLQAQIEELQLKVKRLREERFEVYESGKKAGFMPGELDGKYTNP